jgi:hypothetical protein
MRLLVLQCILVIVGFHCAVACQNGEVILAPWIDGSLKEATIVGVRDVGTCDERYMLSWQHKPICDDATTEYWGEDLKSKQFCIAARDTIPECKRASCRKVSTATGNDEQSGPDTESNRHTVPVVALVLCTLFACCMCLRSGANAYTQRQKLQEDDIEKQTERWNRHNMSAMEKARDSSTPHTSRSGIWSLTPKSMNSSGRVSSQMAAWMDKARWTRQSPDKNQKIMVQPQHVAFSVRQGSGKLGFVEESPVQPESSKAPLGMLAPQNLPGGPAVGMIEKKRTALPQAARIHRAQNPPPQTICAPMTPPPQLPTLLQHVHSPPKSSFRKKPPLQGVPPQESTLAQARKVPAKRVAFLEPQVEEPLPVQTRKGPIKYGTRN